MSTPWRAPAWPHILRRAIRPPRTAHLREEVTSEHAKTDAELGEVEGGAGRRRSAENKAKGARGAPMAGGGAARAERGRDSGREGERARTGWRREWRRRWRCPQRRGEVVAPASRACRPRGAVGLTRSGARGAGRPGLASLARPVGWRRPASEQPPFPFF